MKVPAPEPQPSPLARPTSTLCGVGPERTTQLARLGIHTVEELLLHRPRRYEDRRQLHPIASLSLDQPASARGKIVALGVKWYHHHSKSIFEFIMDDGTARLHCRWWNQPFMEKHFATGDEVFVFGKPVTLRPRTMDHPEVEVVEAGEESDVHFNRVTPIYPLTEGLSQRWLRGLIWRTLATEEHRLIEPWPELNLNGNASPQLSATPHSGLLHSWPSRAWAIRALHFPETEQHAALAYRRLALDEFIDLQRQIQLRRKNFESKAQALPCGGDNRLMRPFLARIGFELTSAQTRVLRQLRQDLSSPLPMRRLLQGDVGSGKTVVAACCSLMALESGYSVALMAPTEILAEQHHANLKRWFEPLGIRVELHTGSHKTTTETPAALQAPTSRLFVGTHALIESGFTADDLGLVIIDEQHKFGVTQRERLVHKGHYPHLLVMTATPIPRTLGLTLYGELDVSVIDELPPGRGRIHTFVRSADRLPKVWDFIRSKLKEGRQGYVVYPRVEETSPNGVKAVVQEYETVRSALAPFAVGLLHGRLKPPEKEEVMDRFRANRIQVLLATSLIEVGVDVANATVMLIENAEQFGLAQLHQLRGRIGRGMHTAHCILLASAQGKEARQRLKVLEDTTDGFRIAEADLKLRGPGELLGQQQSGMPKFRFGDLTEDLDLIQEARRLAARLVERQEQVSEG